MNPAKSGDGSWGKCGCFCHKMNGIFIALIGVTFLLGHLEVLNGQIVGIAWPVLLILLGLKNSVGHGRCPCRSKA